MDSRARQELQVDQRGVTTKYFSTMKIPLIAGRYFTDADLPQNAEQVVIIDNKFAQRFWPRGDAIDKHVWFNPATKLRIVGVVGTVKQYGLDVDGRIVVYRRRRTPVSGGENDGRPATVARAMVKKMHELDPSLTVFDVQTMSDRMSGSMARQRFATTMLGAFAAFAMLLAIVGVYGVMSHLVAQGSHEIGIRMALGADRGGILLMVLAAGNGADRGRCRRRAARRLCPHARDGQSAVRRQHDRSGDVRPRPGRADRDGDARDLRPALRATRVDPTVALREE
jgi:hypothetical protein